MEKIKCAHCQFEVILREGQRYCKYCGKPLMNKCTKQHCGKALDDDAAFCPYCGHESKFKIKGIVNSPAIDFTHPTDSEIDGLTELKDLTEKNIHFIDSTSTEDVELVETKNEQKQIEVFPVFL